MRYRNQAEAYSLDILPRARGDATRLREAANAYREQVIAKAEGESSRFLQTLTEYEKEPAVTRKRLYLETMEYVLANTSKVVMGVKDGNNLMYIPLDKLMESRGSNLNSPDEGASYNSKSPSGEQTDIRLRSSSRSEGGR